MAGGVIPFANPIDLQKNEIRNKRVQNLSSAPSSPVVGQEYFDTTLNAYRVWDGTAWTNKATDSALLEGNNATFYRGRANHTGTQTASTISNFDTQVRVSRLDQMAAPTVDLNLNSRKITSLANGTNANDAVNLGQLQAVQSGLDTKQSVRAASTANVAGTYNATGGASARGQLTAMPNAIDGVTLAAGNRVLLKNQTTGAQNGIWVVTTLGTGANGVWDRASDFDADVEVTSGAFTFVEEGTTNADTGWQLITNDPITIGGASGTALTWAQFSASADITAGAGLTKTGNTLDVGSGNGIIVNADNILVDPAVVTRKFAQTFGNGTDTTFTFTHNLNTQDITVTVREVAGNKAEIQVDNDAPTVNTATVIFAVAPTTNQYRVIIQG